VAVYRIELFGDPYERLMSDPQGAGLPDEVQSAALYTGFELHVMWPRRGTLHVIIEGDGDADEMVGLVAQYLAGGGWEARVERVVAAESPPYWLEAGEQASWVVEQATLPIAAQEGESPTCDLCDWVPVPPHGPPCDAEKREDGTFAVRNYPPRDSSGGGTVASREEDEVTEPVPARARAT
jgi:hypothetical protein